MSDVRIGELWAVLQQPQLPVPAHVMRAKARLMLSLVEQLTPVVTAVAQYRKTIDDFFARMPAAQWARTLPIGRHGITAPTLWARLGDAPGRWASFRCAFRHLQAQAGVVPATKRSGKQRIVHFRFACDKSLRQVVDQVAFLSLLSSDWARAYYDQHRPRPSGSSAPRSCARPTRRTPSASRAGCRSRRPCRRRRGSTNPRRPRHSRCQRWPAHDGESQISDADCLIRLDNFRGADAPGFAMLQAFRSTVKFAVADAGLGIPATLRPTYESHLAGLDDSAALAFAMQPGVTSRPNSGGLGLYHLREVIRRHNGILNVRSAGGKLLVSRGIEYLYQPRGLYRAPTYFWGTQIGVIVDRA